MIAIVEARRAGLLAPKYWASNIVAGVIVGVVALPLAMAFAIASGAKPEQGLYTAIVAGLLTSLFGGSRLQIAGPTGAFIVILSGITAQYGIAGLQIATLIAGSILRCKLNFATTLVIPPNMLIYSIDGPFFFGAASKLEHILESIQQRMDTVVLRMGRVPFVDATGIEALQELHEQFKKRNVRLVLCEIRPNVAAKLTCAGFLQLVGTANIFASRDEFLASLVAPLADASPA